MGYVALVVFVLYIVAKIADSLGVFDIEAPEPVGSRLPGAIGLLRRIEAEHPGSEALVVPVLVVRLGVYLSAADGHVDPREIEAIRAFFVRPGTPLWVVEMLENVIEMPPGDQELSMLLEELKRVVDRDDQQVILFALLNIITADGSVDKGEVSFFFAVTQSLGLSFEEAQAILRQVTGGDGTGETPRSEAPTRSARRSDYDVLGLDGMSSIETIRKSYRELARKYHPDRVEHLGPEFKELAERRMSEINGAYERLLAANS